MTIPALLCIDIEPDPRVPDRARPDPFAGFEHLLFLITPLRERLTSVGGTDARFTWFPRMDPGMADVFGTADWVPATYQRVLDRLRAQGDEFGLHAHPWRWRDGWVADYADEAWIAHCTDVGLETFRDVFGHDCESFRQGDFFMSDALNRQIDAAGVRVDLSLEPGRAPTRRLQPDEQTTGWLPDTRELPRAAYRPSIDDYRVPDPSRRDGLLRVPITPAELWTDPDEFARDLRVRVQQPDLSHLAFAVRSDVGLLPDDWGRIERNLAEICRQLDGHVRWCTAPEAVELIAARLLPTRGPPSGRSRSSPSAMPCRSCDGSTRKGSFPAPSAGCRGRRIVSQRVPSADVPGRRPGSSAATTASRS